MIELADTDFAIPTVFASRRSTNVTVSAICEEGWRGSPKCGTRTTHRSVIRSGRNHCMRIGRRLDRSGILCCQHQYQHQRHCTQYQEQIPEEARIRRQDPVVIRWGKHQHQLRSVEFNGTFFQGLFQPWQNMPQAVDCS
jgi:hypothetical protein